MQRLPPPVHRLQQPAQVHPTVLRWVAAQIPTSPFQQGAASRQVAARVVMQSHRHLDQTLQKLPLRLGSRPPDIFQYLVSFKEIVLVEKEKAFTIGIS